MFPTGAQYPQPGQRVVLPTGYTLAPQQQIQQMQQVQQQQLQMQAAAQQLQQQQQAVAMVRAQQAAVGQQYVVQGQPQQLMYQQQPQTIVRPAAAVQYVAQQPQLVGGRLLMMPQQQLQPAQAQQQMWAAAGAATTVTRLMPMATQQQMAFAQPTARYAVAATAAPQFAQAAQMAPQFASAPTSGSAVPSPSTPTFYVQQQQQQQHLAATRPAVASLKPVTNFFGMGNANTNNSSAAGTPAITSNLDASVPVTQPAPVTAALPPVRNSSGIADLNARMSGNLQTQQQQQQATAPPPPPPAKTKVAKAPPPPPPRAKPSVVEVIDVDEMDDNSSSNLHRNTSGGGAPPPPPPRTSSSHVGMNASNANPRASPRAQASAPPPPPSAPPPMAGGLPLPGTTLAKPRTPPPPLVVSAGGSYNNATATPIGSAYTTPKVAGSGVGLGTYSVQFGAKTNPASPPTVNTTAPPSSGFPSAPVSGLSVSSLQQQGGNATTPSSSSNPAFQRMLQEAAMAQQTLSGAASPSSGYGNVGGGYSRPTSPTPPLSTSARQLPSVGTSLNFGSRPAEKRGRDDRGVNAPPPPPTQPPPGKGMRAEGGKLPMPPSAIDFNGSGSSRPAPPPPSNPPPIGNDTDARTAILLQRYSREDQEARRLMSMAPKAHLAALGVRRQQQAQDGATPANRRFGSGVAGRFASPLTGTAAHARTLSNLSLVSSNGSIKSSPHGRAVPPPPPMGRPLAVAPNPIGAPKSSDGIDFAALTNAPDQRRVMVPAAAALKLTSTNSAIRAYARFGALISEGDKLKLKQERERIRSLASNSARTLVPLDLTDRLITIIKKDLEAEARGSNVSSPTSTVPAGMRGRIPPPPPTGAPPAGRGTMFNAITARAGAAGRAAPLAVAAKVGKLATLKERRPTVKEQMRMNAEKERERLKAARRPAKTAVNIFQNLGGNFATQRKLEAQQRIREMKEAAGYRYELPPSFFEDTDPTNREVIIVDTCALMNMQQPQLQALTLRLNDIELCIPYLVISELDGINKNKFNQEKQLKAKQVREWVLQMQEASLVRLQRREEVDASVGQTAENNDDRILAFAVYVMREEEAKGPEGGQRRVKLLTDDRTFRVKGQAERLTVVDSKELLGADAGLPTPKPALLDQQAPSATTAAVSDVPSPDKGNGASGNDDNDDAADDYEPYDEAGADIY